jgi:broad specificity phosphatase PhoE
MESRKPPLHSPQVTGRRAPLSAGLRLLLVRHAETVWNAAGRIQGQVDPPLSDRGRRQCELLGRRFDGCRVNTIHSSDLQRAAHTADAVAAATGARVVLTKRLREIALGEWEGADSGSLAARWPELFSRWRAEPSWDLVPGGEGETAFRARVAAAVDEVLGSGARTAVLVTHIGVIRLLLSTAFCMPRIALRRPWQVENTSITTLDTGLPLARWGEGVRVLAVNDTLHAGDAQ